MMKITKPKLKNVKKNSLSEKQKSKKLTMLLMPLPTLTEIALSLTEFPFKILLILKLILMKSLLTLKECSLLELSKKKPGKDKTDN